MVSSVVKNGFDVSDVKKGLDVEDVLVHEAAAGEVVLLSNCRSAERAVPLAEVEFGEDEEGQEVGTEDEL